MSSGIEGQAKDIDRRKRFISPKVSKSNLEIVLHYKSCFIFSFILKKPSCKSSKQAFL